MLLATSDLNHYEDDATTRVKDAKAVEKLLALDARGLFDVCRDGEDFDVRVGAGGRDDYGAAGDGSDARGIGAVRDFGGCFGGYELGRWLRGSGLGKSEVKKQ